MIISNSAILHYYSPMFSDHSFGHGGRYGSLKVEWEPAGLTPKESDFAFVGQLDKRTEAPCFLVPVLSVRDTFEYTLRRCSQCDALQPHQYHPLKMHMSRCKITERNEGPLEKFRLHVISTSSVPDEPHWFLVQVWGDGALIMYQAFASTGAINPLEDFRRYECLTCRNDPRVGALTLINPLEGALTVLDKGSLTMA